MIKMGSVIDEVTCPHCGYTHATSDFYYKTREEYVSCPRCGSYYAYEIDNWYEGENVPTDWKPHFKETKIITNHAFCYGEKKGIRSCGGLKHNELKRFKEIFKSNSGVETATYTYKYKGVWYEKDIVSGEKKSFKTYMEDNENG